MWGSQLASTPMGGVVHQLVVSNLGLVEVPLAWIVHHSSRVDAVVVFRVHDGGSLLVP